VKVLDSRSNSINNEALLFPKFGRVSQDCTSWQPNGNDLTGTCVSASGLDLHLRVIEISWQSNRVRLAVGFPLGFPKFSHFLEALDSLVDLADFTGLELKQGVAEL
jgi:hypothetical protein